FGWSQKLQPIGEPFAFLKSAKDSLHYPLIPCEPFNIIGCPAEPPELLRKSHHSHSTFKSSIQAGHG
ncbi:MAG: hypothetical protein UDQ58_04730, partial [Desulfovibrio sp.]|nr:hypothetical protein [Desulfovibrio sp.]